MEDAVKLIAIGIIAAILAITIKKTNPELAVQVSIAAGVVIFFMLLSYLSSAIEMIRDFASQYQEVYDGIKIVLKIIGIAYLCEFAIQVLRDAGEGAIASKVELGGKLIILVITLPLLTSFTQRILSIL